MCETRKRIEIKQIAWRIIKPTNVVIISTSVILKVFSLYVLSYIWGMDRKNRLFTLDSVELTRQMQNLEPSEESATASIIEAEHDTSQSTSKKTLKWDTWSNNQTGALIKSRKENFFEIETYPLPSA